VSTEFCVRRRVQFHETDAAGIVHFSCFFRYMEEGEHALWRAAGLSIYRPNEEIGWPRVAASFDYRRPLRFEDEFDICTRVVAVTNRTIRYACVLRKDGDEIASGSLTVACVAKRPNEPMQAIDLPPAIAAHFRGLVDSQTS
jgi:YbgC/YbaW family acyl-CoA thioester hydrolase